MAADANVLLTHITTSSFVVLVLNWLKSFPWITAEKTKLLRVLAVLLAGVKAVGISWTWNPVNHSLLIANLSLAMIAAGVWHWAQSFAVQELIYQTTKNKNGNSLPAGMMVGKMAPSMDVGSAAPAAKP